MQTLTHAGARYRSKLLPEEKARAFAACLTQNPHFTAVQVEESRTAKGAARHFVAYVPTNPERRAAMLDRESAKREVRGVLEGQHYHFCLDQDGGRFFWCLSVSGEVYEVTAATCTCPDFTFRCQREGLKCKHIHALTAGVGTMEGVNGPERREPAPQPPSRVEAPAQRIPVQAETPEERRARIIRQRDRDFPPDEW